MNHSHEPLIHIAKRDGLVWWKNWLIRLCGVLLALIVSALFIYSISKLNPVKVYGAMWDGAFGTSKRSWVTIRDTMFLLCIGIGLAPAFMMRFWNIGAEGQILVGGCATAAVMIYCGNTMPTWVMLIIMFFASCLAGAIWGLIPAVFKAHWNTNETLFTLMMNYIAIQLTNFLVSKWESPPGSNAVGVINLQTQSGWFPAIFGQQYLLNIVIVLVLAVCMYVYLRNSKQGYEIAVVGESENTARYAGISVKKVIIRTMAISGAICGVAGFVNVAGAAHTISTEVAGGRGFTAIIVAWLAKFNTFVMILIAILIVFLQKGAVQIASQFNLNDYVSNVVTGIILFFILGSEFFINYQLRFRSGKNAKEAE